MTVRTAALVTLVTVVAASLPASASATTTRGTAADRSLAGRHWHYRAQVDGRKGPDRIDVAAGSDLHLDAYGFGSGHVTVTVRLAGRHKTVRSRQFLDYLSVRSPWTPYLGATNLDKRGGKEILMGFSTGAHAQLFTALTYRGGHLRVLKAPGGTPYWMVNSSYGTGSQGWRCTAHGVQARSVMPLDSAGKHYRIVVNGYRRSGTHWRRVSHTARTVAGVGGQPPTSTDTFPELVCAGVPHAVL